MNALGCKYVTDQQSIYILLREAEPLNKHSQRDAVSELIGNWDLFGILQVKSCTFLARNFLHYTKQSLGTISQNPLAAHPLENYLFISGLSGLGQLEQLGQLEIMLLFPAYPAQVSAITFLLEIKARKRW